MKPTPSGVSRFSWKITTPRFDLTQDECRPMSIAQTRASWTFTAHLLSWCNDLTPRAIVDHGATARISLTDPLVEHEIDRFTGNEVIENPLDV